MGIVTIQSGGLQEQYFPYVPYIPLVFGGSYRHLPNMAARILTTTTITMTANRLYYMPFILGRRLRVTKLGFIVSTTGGTRGRCGVYSTGANNMPSTLIAQTGDLTTGAQGFQETAMDFWLDEGIVYWSAVACDGGPILSAIASSSLPCIGASVSGTTISNRTTVFQDLSSGWQELPANASTSLTLTTSSHPSVLYDFSAT